MIKSKETREQQMQKALALHSEWERALMGLSNGREYDELSVEEQVQYMQISTSYNEQIEKLLEAAFPVLKKE